jgi:hypothetical protein
MPPSSCDNDVDGQRSSRSERDLESQPERECEAKAAWLFSARDWPSLERESSAIQSKDTPTMRISCSLIKGDIDNVFARFRMCS